MGHTRGFIYSVEAMEHQPSSTLLSDLFYKRTPGCINIAVQRVTLSLAHNPDLHKADFLPSADSSLAKAAATAQILLESASAGPGLSCTRGPGSRLSRVARSRGGISGGSIFGMGSL